MSANGVTTTQGRNSWITRTTVPIQYFDLKERFELEGGGYLPELRLAYCTYGTLNETADNVIWVCHALTANSDAQDWWSGFWGKGKLFDPERYFIVCANIPGSCYGSTGPDHLNPETGTRWGSAFPLITIGDVVRALRLLRNHLGIRQIEMILGGSMGGQQAIEWAVQEPDAIRHLCAIATNARHSPWGIAFNEAQRLAIQADPTYLHESSNAGEKGLIAARSIGMISYRNFLTFEQTQLDLVPVLQDHRAATYQRYQGLKLSNRFTPLAYLSLSRTMDSHHLGRGRESIDWALQSIRAKTLVIGIDTDVLFPSTVLEEIAGQIPNARFEIIHSDFGHDGFLLEYDVLHPLILNFMLSDTD
ncbi:MAG: homoserine O-acetyltransferase [Saprospiraceae bacterium]